MSDVAVRVENLGKQYRIGGAPQKYRTLRETLVSSVSAPVRRLNSAVHGRLGEAHGRTGTFWALRDISFDVKHGEVIGIIGHNGAGKSTLLKILSRITEPTAGRAVVYGRVGALLEVGTGFHPELTGRENVYLNAAILGMKRHEIDRKFDEIVAFAEIEKFIDMPVKHYSSGMGLRLGFAVAAHLELEIMIIDEVLAVGDAAFQKKCLGKMSDVAGQGRTVLFVSHNMAAVESLCSKTMLLERGQITAFDETDKVVQQYLLQSVSGDSYIDLTDHPERTPNSQPILQYMAFRDSQGELRNTFQTGDPITIEVGLHSNEMIQRPQVGIAIDNWIGQRLFTMSTRFQNTDFPSLHGAMTVTCQLPSVYLAPGNYSIKLTLGLESGDIDIIRRIPAFEIIPADVYGSGKLPRASQGVFYVIPDWTWSTPERALADNEPPIQVTERRSAQP